MARRGWLPSKTLPNTGADATRRKIDQIVQLVVDAADDRDFDAIAAREIKRLQSAPVRRTLLRVR